MAEFLWHKEEEEKSKVGFAEKNGLRGFGAKKGREEEDWMSVSIDELL